tara:strand:- start:1061 stop:3589 length:2529 start_codon:yes stop_codon:yes gene_type:complete
MNSDQIRKRFLNYFKDNDHKILNSSSLIPHDDTLLFTAAGMVPLKDYFMGLKKPPHKNLASSQKCIRTVDIDIVGETDRHLTFFEMLGNFSIDNYFKEEAIKLSYKFITEELKVPSDDLWFTVYKDDDESYNIWKDIVGVPEHKIQKGDKDNFWHMNIPGPCGPCSEIFIDRGPEYGKEGGPIGGGEDRFIEIWNLVFMQSIQDEPYNVVDDLPAKNIDTGMGLERMAMVLQDKDSPFEIDTFQNLYNELNKYIVNKDKKYERIVLDHIKSAVFMISDGVVPTNEGRGYILRRIIRRAVRAIYRLTDELMSLDFLINIVINDYQDSYPELLSNKDKILNLYKNEEELFQNTLVKGNQEIQSILKKKSSIDEKDAFYLFETFGFPFELTQETAKEHDIVIDYDKFNDLFNEHRKKSNSGKKEKISNNISDVDNNTFVGYDKLSVTSDIYHVENQENDSVIFTTQTPFYFEAGGQISDIGNIVINDKDITVKDVVQSDNGATGIVVESNILKVGDKIELNVDPSFRSSVSKSHTAAHIVHASLRNILGDHVAQAGSHVAPGKFRFDFSHTEKVKNEELNEIFKMSNDSIYKDIEVKTNVMNIDQAKKEGALAFFGDKYEDDVRVVNIGEFSKELCGGTHVHNSNEVGLIVLINESSIGSNLRRVEMLSGHQAYSFMSSAYESYKTVSDILQTSVEQVPEKLKSYMETYEEMKEKLDNQSKIQNDNELKRILSEAIEINNYKTYIGKVNVNNSNDAKIVATRAIKDHELDFVFLLANIETKTVLIGSRSEKSLEKIDVSNIVGEASKLYNGGASKDPSLSIGGGPSQYDDTKCIDFVTKLLKKHI